MFANAIHFTDDTKLEEGLRIITFNGPVVFTGHKGVYRVPNYVLAMLDEAQIPYERVNLPPSRNPLLLLRHQSVCATTGITVKG